MQEMFHKLQDNLLHKKQIILFHNWNCLISLVCNWMHDCTGGKRSTLFLINSLQCVAYLIDQGCTDKLCYSKWQLWANILWRKIGCEIIQYTWSKEISPVLVAKKSFDSTSTSLFCCWTKSSRKPSSSTSISKSNSQVPLSWLLHSEGDDGINDALDWPC